VAEKYTAALGSPGFAQLGRLLDDDGHLEFPGLDDAHGRDSVVHAHDVLFGSFDGRAVALGRVWRTASTQTLEWTMTGVHVKEWMGVPPSHKAVAFRGLTLLWTKDDGSITDVHIYFDVAVVKAQLGAGPKELASLPLASVPSGPPQVFEQKGTPEETYNLDVARDSLDALENNREAAYLDLRTDDVEVDSLERVAPARGKDEAKAYCKAMHKAIGQLDTTIDNAWAVGPFVVVEYYIAGELLGPLGWVPAQRDKVIRLHVAQIDELRNGKIARVSRYENPAELVGMP
jgi:ketosteroid isomerase-like protein